MMRVLFVTLSEKSHVSLRAPLAWALTAAGHEVRVASRPMATEAITQAGLTAVRVCSDYGIHHGGYGSFATAMADAVPQRVLSTLVSDHELRGRALQRAGAGVHLHHWDATAKKVRDHIRQLTGEPEFAEAARRLRAGCEAMPSPHDVVPALERLAEVR